VTLETDKEKMRVMLNSSPLACAIVTRDNEVIDANEQIGLLFGIDDANEYLKEPERFSPEVQPDGQNSIDKVKEMIRQAYDQGHAYGEWMHQSATGEAIPSEMTFVRVVVTDEPIVLYYINDLRELRNLALMKSQMEKLAFTDSLTGLFNRRYFIENAEAELVLCNQSKETMAILIADIDHFKKINDNNGHAFGDEVLKIFAKRIKDVLRHDTLLARFGGEEFAVALPRTDLQIATITAERLLEAINSKPFEIDGQFIDVTMSIGVACTTSFDLPLSELMHRADTAMYEAKHKGRNQVMLFCDDK